MSLQRLFELKKFPPKISWENASKILEVDRRWGSFGVLTRGDKKQTFAEYMSQRRKREAEGERTKRRQAKELLFKALEKWEGLAFNTTYVEAADRFHCEEWWTWMPEAERDDVFNDWLADNEAFLKEKFRHQRRRDCAKVRVSLSF